jgi:hypothetical protein
MKPTKVEPMEYKNPKQINNYEIEAVIKSIPTNRIQEPDEFTDEFYQTFKEELTHCSSYYSIK